MLKLDLGGTPILVEDHCPNPDCLNPDPYVKYIDSPIDFWVEINDGYHMYIGKIEFFAYRGRFWKFADLKRMNWSRTFALCAICGHKLHLEQENSHD